MMNNNFRQSYKVNRTAIEEAYANHLGLKINEEYENWVNNCAVELLGYFLNRYKGIRIELPKMREKSPRSLLGKLKNLQIERLSKLYAIEGISDKEKETLYLLIKERINENTDLDDIKILDIIKKLIYKGINKFNIKEFEREIMIPGISNSTKTALLRILISKIEKSDLSNKRQMLQSLDEKYGKLAVVKSGVLEDDIIKYDSIIDIRKNKSKINRLRDEQSFLKANDLRGMKIVVVEIPDDFETDNEEIKQLLEKRKSAKSSTERVIYTHNAIVELGKEFYNDLANNQQLLERLNIKVIPGSNKHKKKTNGYEAEHIKFYNSNKPQYTLEMQFKSEYIETICRGEGTASHENRPGKSRVLPHADNDIELMKMLNFMVPKYTIFKLEENNIKPKKVSMLNNVMAYFQGKIQPGSEEYEKIIKLFSNQDEKQIAM